MIENIFIKEVSIMKEKYVSPLEFPKAIPFCSLDYGSIDLDNVVSDKFDNIAGVLAIHKGKVVLEKYFHNHNNTDTFHVASVTKSIISALIGIALDKGCLQSIDQRLMDIFPEYNDLFDNECKQSITIKHLLTMTVPYDFPDWNEPFDKFCSSSDWTKYIINNLGINGRPGDFKYSTEGAHLLSCIITRATGKSAREFANQYLFTPLGINAFPDYKPETYGFDYLFGKDLKSWPHDPQENSTGGWGLNLTLRNIALFGFLYMNDGFYDGRQIISKSWIQQSTTPFSAKKVFLENQYGYLWWINHYDSSYCYSAVGDGGNIISCIPDKDLVIVVSAQVPKPIENPYEFIEKYVIPYIL